MFNIRKPEIYSLKLRCHNEWSLIQPINTFSLESSRDLYSLHSPLIDPFFFLICLLSSLHDHLPNPITSKLFSNLYPLHLLFKNLQDVNLIQFIFRTTPSITVCSHLGILFVAVALLH